MSSFICRQDLMESRYVCKTELKKNCQPVRETGCLDVTGRAGSRRLHFLYEYTVLYISFPLVFRVSFISNLLHFSFPRNIVIENHSNWIFYCQLAFIAKFVESVTFFIGVFLLLALVFLYPSLHVFKEILCLYEASSAMCLLTIIDYQRA